MEVIGGLVGIGLIVLVVVMSLAARALDKHKKKGEQLAPLAPRST